MSIGNIHIFTHNDLDGAGSLLALTWAFADYEITYTTVSSPHSFNEDFNKAVASKPLYKYEKVFVVDLSILQKDIHLIDVPNVIFIDHHKTSTNLTFEYAKSFIKVYSSCVLYIYNLFKSSLNINSSQKQLIVLIDDYDSYELKFNNSKLLNTLYWAHYKSSVPLFLADFSSGFTSFNYLQKNAISIYESIVNSTINNLSVFKATIPVQGGPRLIVSTFASTGINDVAEYILTKYNADISIVVNLKTERVSFRKNNSNIDVSLLAQKLCDGGGHEAAAGGKITEKFLAFTKLFTQT